MVIHRFYTFLDGQGELDDKICEDARTGPDRPAHWPVTRSQSFGKRWANN